MRSEISEQMQQPIDLRTAPSPTNVRASGVPYFTPVANTGQAQIAEKPVSVPTLFRPLTIRNVTLKNRIFVAPMCTFSAESDPASPMVGALTDYHIAHLGSFAIRGPGLIMIEATAVQVNGRITPNDSGLWMEGTCSEQFRSLERLVGVLHSQGAKVGIQLAHAGRKASTVAPWLASRAGVHSLKAGSGVGGWPEDIVGPCGGTEHAWSPDEIGYWPPREITIADIEEVVRSFARSAALAVRAGVDVIEIHGAHGYLISSFLSPVTNRRTDKYGGSFDNRVRLLQEISHAVRNAMPNWMPLFLRISVTEWLEDDHLAAEYGTWDMASSSRLAKLLPEMGIDFLDVSSGGNHRNQKIKFHKSYQVDLAAQLRKEIRASNQQTLVDAVGLITEPRAAAQTVQNADDEVHRAEPMLAGLEPKADAILIGRQFLREADWVLKAAKELGVNVTVPDQYARAYL